MRSGGGDVSSIVDDASRFVRVLAVPGSAWAVTGGHPVQGVSVLGLGLTVKLSTKLK